MSGAIAVPALAVILARAQFGFAMGVVSGLVMAYEIGANWSGYSFKSGRSWGRCSPGRR